jgi:hypothetical protein
LVGLAFLNRRAKDMQSPTRFKKSIHREMQRIKTRKHALALTMGIALGRYLPGGVWQLCRARRCQATAVLTNPGPVFDRHPLLGPDGRVTLGSMVLESLDFLAPVRPKTNIALATCTYAGRLHITLHYDPFSIEAAQAQNILHDYLRDLRDHLRNSPTRKED